MPELAELAVRIRPDGIERVEGALGRVDRGFSGIQSRVLTVNQALELVGRGSQFVQRLGQSFVDPAAQVQSLQTRLVNLTGSETAAAKEYERFVRLAATTPFDLQGVANAGATLLAFGEKNEDALRAVADLAAFMGTDVKEAASAYGRAFAGGAGAAEILRERGVLALVKTRAGIDDLTKLSLPQFRKVLFESMVDPTGPIAGATERLSKTWQGLTSNVGDSFFQLRATIGAAVTESEASSRGLRRVSDVLNDLTGRTGEWIDKNQDLIDQNIDEVFSRIVGALEKLPGAAERLGGVASTIGQGMETIETGFDGILSTWNSLPEGLRDVLVAMIVGGGAARAGAGLALGLAGLGKPGLAIAGAGAAGVGAGLGLEAFANRILDDAAVDREARRIASERYGARARGPFGYNSLSDDIRSSLTGEARRNIAADPEGLIASPYQRARIARQQLIEASATPGEQSSLVDKERIDGANAMTAATKQQLEELEKLNAKLRENKTEVAELTEEQKKALKAADDAFLTNEEAISQRTILQGLLRSGSITAQEYAAAEERITKQLEEQDPLMVAHREHLADLLDELEGGAVTYADYGQRQRDLNILWEQGRISANQYALGLDDIEQRLRDQDPLMAAYRDNLNELRNDAERFRAAAHPEEGLARRLARLDRAREQNPDIIDDKTYERERKAAQEEFDRLESDGTDIFDSLTKAADAFSRGLSRGIADAALGGTRSIKSLGRSIVAQLLQAQIHAILFGNALRDATGASGGGSSSGGIFGLIKLGLGALGGLAGAGAGLSASTPIATSSTPFSGANYAAGIGFYSQGGIVPRYYASGGVVGPDTVPAMLTPGEAVLPVELTSLLTNAARGREDGGGQGDSHQYNFNISVQTLDGKQAANVLMENESLILGMFQRDIQRAGSSARAVGRRR